VVEEPIEGSIEGNEDVGGGFGDVPATIVNVFKQRLWSVVLKLLMVL
jgi:hypothetical protein